MKVPSDFMAVMPMSSITRKHEAEIVARNIMTILARTGDTFRQLSWEEYETERLKDGNFTLLERAYFDQVVGYCQSEIAASLFSPSWKDL